MRKLAWRSGHGATVWLHVTVSIIRWQDGTFWHELAENELGPEVNCDYQAAYEKKRQLSQDN